MIISWYVALIVCDTFSYKLRNNVYWHAIDASIIIKKINGISDKISGVYVDSKVYEIR